MKEEATSRNQHTWWTGDNKFCRGLQFSNCYRDNEMVFLPGFSRSLSLDRYSVNRRTSGCEKMGFLFYVEKAV